MVFFIFPIHLFKDIDDIIETGENEVLLIEEPIYFLDWERKLKFNKKKLLFHRATMKIYYEFLKNHSLIKKNRIKVSYLEWNKINTKIKWQSELKSYKKIICYDPVDHLLESRLESLFSVEKNELIYLETPLFLTPIDDLNEFMKFQKDKKVKRPFNQTSFYSWQRKRLNLLLTSNGKPIGGRLTYDVFNRSSLPNNISIPPLPSFPKNKYIQDGIKYVEKWWPNNYGDYDNFIYPINFEECYEWFNNFLKKRFFKFGEYQDAISEREDPILFHSGISALLNVGLLEPVWIVEKVLDYWKKEKVNIESVEGFLRQIVGWREFSRLVYIFGYEEMVSGNYFKAEEEIDKRWYDGSFGILPLDLTIRKAFKTGYLHHIERLMIMSNFMCLWGLKPIDGYKWFMEFAIDSYDWVMVYNVYSMGLYADGGMTTSKVYISSSNYIIKMSDFKKGEWSEKWDALYWNFIGKHQDKIRKMGRLAFQVKYYENKSDDDKKEMKRIISSLDK